jgi:t-SNARE complex subunit (syntaxin)
MITREPQIVAPGKAKKGRNNFRIVQTAITIIAIVVLVLVVFQLYYPTLLPWNW